MNNCAIDNEPDDNSSLYVEVDPTGRYGRYSEILGKGASKIVYKGFDEYKGIEVAWNQVKLSDFVQRPEDLERICSEIHLLKTLNHKNIMTFYSSWVDTAERNINFVTEMFNSGTLRQYRLKHKKVNIRAVKQWCRQILEGLLYLHNHEPRVIHRDLKCDNIFINGNQGQVKIGDLGLAAILSKSHAAHCVGTPEFMAPEVYSEEYNELVDIYSFGMCVLEMVTFEYPYSECTHPAQIYMKVTNGKKPDALYKVIDPEVRFFVEKCLASVSERLSAQELLDDPFLRIDDLGKEMRVTNREDYFDKVDRVLQLPDQNEDRSVNTDITINGKRKEDGDIFLRLRIRDREGQTRNIYFPFDTEIDTALSVAAEMVAELEIDDQDVTRIADMIDSEIASLVPSWKTVIVVGYESNNPETNTVESNSNPLLRLCSSYGSSSMKGRFEEITEDNYGTDYRDKLPHHHRRPSFRFHGLTEFKVDLGTPHNPPVSSVVDEIEYENAILKEQIWFKAMQLREQTNKNPSALSKPPVLPIKKKNNEAKKSSFLSGERGLDVNELKKTLKKHFRYNFPSNFSKKNCIQDAFI